MNAGTHNAIRLTGEITALDSLRHTPGGLPLVNVRLLHRSMQTEAGIPRQIECEVGAVAIGDIANAVAAFKTGDSVTVEGFLAAKRRMGAQLGTQLVLHIQNIVKPSQT